MIEEIQFTNMKGQTGIQPLTGMDIFTGRNGAGKTTRLQALGLSMLGYVPKNGKTAQETFKLATGDEMTVGLRTSDFAFARTFKKHEKRNNKSGEITTVIKEGIAVSPGRGEANDTAKKTRIATELGDFAAMLDFNEFLSLSDCKRRDFIYSLSPITSSTWSKSRIDEYLRQTLLTGELMRNNMQQYKVMTELINQAIDQFPDHYGVSEGLQAMLDWSTQQRSIWSSKQKDAQGATRQLAEKKNELEETDRNIASSKLELDDLHQRLVTAESQIAKDQERQKAIRQRLDRLQELEKLIQDIKTAPDHSGQVQEIAKQIEELRRQLQPVPDIQAEIDQMKATGSTEKDQYCKLDQEASNFDKQIMTIQATMQSLKDALQKTGELSGKCVLNAFIRCDRDFSGFGDYVDGKKVEADQKIAELEEKKSQIIKQMNELEQSDQQRNIRRETLLTQVQDIQRKNQDVNDQILSLERKSNELLNAAARAADQLNLYQTEYDRLNSQPAEPIGPLDAMQKLSEGIRSQISNLKATIDGKEKAKQTLLLMQQSLLENREADLKAGCLKLIVEKLGPKGVQGELVKEVLDPIRQDIGNNLKLMGHDCEPFFQTESETGKEIFQFGWINEKGHPVNFDALSTGQQTVFLAAMLITIIDRAQPKTRLLVIDDLNHLDRENFQMLINGISKVRSKLDNVILAGAIAFPFDTLDWKVWELSDVMVEEQVKKSA